MGWYFGSRAPGQKKGLGFRALGYGLLSKLGSLCGYPK